MHLPFYIAYIFYIIFSTPSDQSTSASQPELKKKKAKSQAKGSTSKRRKSGTDARRTFIASYCKGDLKGWIRQIYKAFKPVFPGLQVSDFYDAFKKVKDLDTDENLGGMYTLIHEQLRKESSLKTVYGDDVIFQQGAYTALNTKRTEDGHYLTLHGTNYYVEPVEVPIAVPVVNKKAASNKKSKN